MNFPSLFSPLQVGPYRLQHRVAMAPLTRMRAERSSFAPRALNAEYYGQRATPGGLIIAEASPVMATGRGNADTPGIYSEQQIKGWRAVVDAVDLLATTTRHLHLTSADECREAAASVAGAIARLTSRQDELTEASGEPRRRPSRGGRPGRATPGARVPGATRR